MRFWTLLAFRLHHAFVRAGAGPVEPQKTGHLRPACIPKSHFSGEQVKNIDMDGNRNFPHAQKYLEIPRTAP